MPRGIPNSAPMNAPVTSTDLDKFEYPVLDLTSPSVTPRSAQDILPVEVRALPEGQPERLAFMEEPIVVRLEPTAERNPRKFARSQVNNDVRWIPIGVPVRLQRKFVEVLLRAQPFGVQTDVGSTFEANPHNRVIRTAHHAYPLTVLKDPSPRGSAWLRKVAYEG